MSTQYHSHGLVGQAIRWICIWAEEEETARRRFTDSDLLRMWSGNLDELLSELRANGDSPPLSNYTFTSVAGQQYYKLPPNVQEIRRIGCVNTTTGLLTWEIVPENYRCITGPNVLFDGGQDLQLVPIPQTGGDSITVTYVPGGNVSFHQNAAPLYSGNNDSGTLQFTSTTLQLSAASTDWLVGDFDRRPNAFTGFRLRVLGTVNNAVAARMTVPWFPIQERKITTYDVFTALTASVLPAFDAGVLSGGSDWSNWAGADKVNLLPSPGTEARTYFIYEIVPDLDPQILASAALMTSIEIASMASRTEKVKSLEKVLQRKKRSLIIRLSSAQNANPQGMESPLADVDDIWRL